MYLIHRPRKKALLTSVREKPIEQFSWGKPANWGSFHVQAQKKTNSRMILGLCLHRVLKHWPAAILKFQSSIILGEKGSAYLHKFNIIQQNLLHRRKSLLIQRIQNYQLFLVYRHYTCVFIYDRLLTNCNLLWIFYEINLTGPVRPEDHLKFTC